MIENIERHVGFVAQAVLMVVWVLCLRTTSALYSNYVLIGVLGCLALCGNVMRGRRVLDHERGARKLVSMFLFSAMFSIATVIAECETWSEPIATAINPFKGKFVGEIYTEEYTNSDNDLTVRYKTRTISNLSGTSDLFGYVENATIEQKKMIVNSMITRIDVFSGYELNVEFAFDIRQFFEGIDSNILIA